jgi:hypothetical protein
MTEQTELTDDQKAALGEQEKQARMWTRIQLDEQAKKAREDDFNRLPSMTNADFARYTKENFGF